MTTKTTKVRLFAGAEPLVIADAKLYTPGAHMHPAEMYQSSAMEAEDGALYKNQLNGTALCNTERRIVSGFVHIATYSAG